MRCLNCNLAVSDGAKECPLCKAKINREYIRCPECFVKLDINERVCPKCGCDLTVNYDGDFFFFDDENKKNFIYSLASAVCRYAPFVMITAVAVLIGILVFFYLKI